MLWFSFINTQVYSPEVYSLPPPQQSLRISSLQVMKRLELPTVCLEGSSFGTCALFSWRSSGLCSFKLLDKVAFYRVARANSLHSDFYKDKCYPASQNISIKLKDLFLITMLILDFILQEKACSRNERKQKTNPSPQSGTHCEQHSGKPLKAVFLKSLEN